MEIRHNGLARFGELHLDPSGILSMRQSDDKEYLSFGGLFPTLDNILSLSADTIPRIPQVGRVTEQFTGTSTPLLGETRERSLLSSGSSRATVGMQIQVRGRIDLSVTSPALVVPGHPPSGGGVAILDPWLPISSPPVDLVPMNGSARVDLYLCVGTSKRLLESYQVQDTQSKSLQVDKSWTTSEEGEVSVVAECWALLHGNEQRATMDLYDFSLSGVKRHEDFDLVKISRGGMVHLYGIDRYIYISKSDPNVMTIGGNTLQRGNHRIEGNLEVTGAITMSGSLARGEVNRLGGVAWCNGCKAIPTGRTTGFAERLSDMSYKVYHNIGHTRYAVSITPTEDTAPICASVIERAPTYFRVMLRKGSDWNMTTNKISCSFTYAIEGNLTAQ